MATDPTALQVWQSRPRVHQIGTTPDGRTIATETDGTGITRAKVLVGGQEVVIPTNTVPLAYALMLRNGQVQPPPLEENPS
jgi:hypothetical protein